MGIFDSIFGGKKNDKENKSVQNNSNGLPEWFDGEVYEKGDTVFNPFTFTKVMLKANELAIYDFIKGAQHTLNNDENLNSTKRQQLLIDLKKGIEWFKENNPEAYNILIVGLNPNETKEETTTSSNEVESDKKSKIKIIQKEEDFKKLLLSDFKEYVGEDTEYYHLSFAVFLSEQNFLKEGTGEADDELVFRGYELVVSARWWNDEEEYDEHSIDEEAHLLFYTAGKNRDTGEIYIIENHPQGYSEGVDEDEDLIEGNLKEVSEYLSKIKTIDYESLSPSDKKDFVEIITN